MLSQNLTVHGLWIGPRLSLMEQLTLRSFTACGHKFALWLYGPLDSDVPAGVEIRDAQEVLPAKDVFCYQAGPRPGSYAGFSDVFRYKLLYDHGGWWSDLDVACLRPLDFEQWYAFSPSDGLGLIGNVMKAPPRSDLMRRCFLWAVKHVDAQNTDWLKPIRVLVAEVRRMRLAEYVLPPNVISPQWKDGERFATTAAEPPADLHLIHWCNEWLKSQNFEKDRPLSGTTYHALLAKHGLI
ncbi:MAG: glycosyltransferase [Pirellulales bacterium]